MTSQKGKFSQQSYIVYSSEHGAMCPHCNKPKKQCVCKQNQKSQVPVGDGVVRVARSSKHRGGKCVSVVTGILLAEDKLKDLATKLKKKCGTGGTVKDGVIEIQGDHREMLVAELVKLGYQAKLAGG